MPPVCVTSIQIPAFPSDDPRCSYRYLGIQEYVNQ